MNPTAEKVKAVRSAVVNLLKANSYLQSWCGDRIYPTDLYVLSLKQYPAVTVQIVRKKPGRSTGGANGFIDTSLFFKVRAYSRVTNIEKIEDEQIELGETVSQLFQKNYSVPNVYYDSNVMDTEYLFLQNKETRDLFLQYVETLLECKTMLPRNSD